MCIPPYGFDTAGSGSEVIGSVTETNNRDYFAEAIENKEEVIPVKKKKARMSRMEKARMYGGKF